MRNTLRVFTSGILSACSGLVLGVWHLAEYYDLATGNYKDGDGKFIRQVVQLKKEEISESDHKTTLLMCMFLGFFVAHQFYNGKFLEGVLMFFTFGGLGLFSLYNLYQLGICDFQDANGKYVCPSYVKKSCV